MSLVKLLFLTLAAASCVAGQLWVPQRGKFGEVCDGNRPCDMDKNLVCNLAGQPYGSGSCECKTQAVTNAPWIYIPALETCQDPSTPNTHPHHHYSPNQPQPQAQSNPFGGGRGGNNGGGFGGGSGGNNGGGFGDGGGSGGNNGGGFGGGGGSGGNNGGGFGGGSGGNNGGGSGGNNGGGFGGGGGSGGNNGGGSGGGSGGNNGGGFGGGSGGNNGGGFGGGSGGNNGGGSGGNNGGSFGGGRDGGSTTGEGTTCVDNRLCVTLLGSLSRCFNSRCQCYDTESQGRAQVAEYAGRCWKIAREGEACTDDPQCILGGSNLRCIADSGNSYLKHCKCEGRGCRNGAGSVTVTSAAMSIGLGLIAVVAMRILL